MSIKSTLAAAAVCLGVTTVSLGLSAPAFAKTFDEHGCIIPVRSGSLCLALESGSIYHVFDSGTYAAAGYNPSVAVPLEEIDLSAPKGTIRYRINGIDDWFRSIGKLTIVEYNGSLIPLEQYKKQLPMELALKQMNQHYYEDSMNAILAPECTHSYNGC